MTDSHRPLPPAVMLWPIRRASTYLNALGCPAIALITAANKANSQLSAALQCTASPTPHAGVAPRLLSAMSIA